MKKQDLKRRDDTSDRMRCGQLLWDETRRGKMRRKHEKRRDETRREEARWN